MSWHKTHRTTVISQAVLASLLGMTNLSAYAINLGQANIQSAQHEPLSATIRVSDIDARNFHASLATADIYQQLGLTPNAKININFMPTSDTSGEITLSSNTPIDTPFADIVLNLTNNGEQIIEPQTLLMPLPKDGTFTLPKSQETHTIVADSQQDLPIVTPLEEQPTGAIDVLNIDAYQGLEPSNQQDVSNDTPEDTLAHESSYTNQGQILSQEDVVISQITPEGTNTQIDVLTAHLTRQILPTGQTPTLSEPSDPEPAISHQANNFEKETTTETTPQDGQATYVVQSGDTLWSIANQIAQANNLSVDEVMNAIHAANIDAFNQGNINKLKANASLSLPNYDVIPSQKAIQDAIATKRSHQVVANTKKSGNKKISTSQTKATARRGSQVTAKPTTKALPKAQMTLVTPSQHGHATGTNNKAAHNAAVGGGTDLVNTLKNTRQQTATTAQRVNGLNQELSSARQKLQLHNQKLAELEARLEALKEKK